MQKNKGGRGWKQRVQEYHFRWGQEGTFWGGNILVETCTVFLFNKCHLSPLSFLFVFWSVVVLRNHAFWIRLQGLRWMFMFLHPKCFPSTASVTLCVNVLKGWRATSQVGKLHMSCWVREMVHKIGFIWTYWNQMWRNLKFYVLW